ncbi:hypothetical protein BJV78DRAFT_1219503 [Lactifluus subvellereus]|nr:hypothetical protein BJV78DRAFT_1219503 [Lactifluus subvellereus]
MSDARSHVTVQQYMTAVREHAWLGSIAFLVVLPLGSLVSRYFRTFTTKWWFAHWIVNFLVSGPLVIASWVKGVQATGGGRMDHHKRVGTAIFGLYIVQVVLGAFIHFVRIPFPLLVHRPLSNYAHVLLGVTILALSEYQIYNGIYIEWPLHTRKKGIAPIPKSLKHAWLALVIASHV